MVLFMQAAGKEPLRTACAVCTGMWPRRPTACCPHFAQVKGAVRRFTSQQLASLQGEEEEVVAGVDWQRVAAMADIGQQLDELLPGE